MRHVILLFVFVLFSVTGCKKDCFDLAKYDYELVLEDGIYVEKFESDVTDENRYNSNNEIYTLCKEFIYDYYYEDVNGEQFFFEREKGNDEIDEDNSQDWFFTPKNDPKKRTIVQIKKVVRSGLEPFTDIAPDYNQSIIKYMGIQKNGKCKEREETGLVENEMNIWTHPPRYGLFRMLEFTPFPFIQAPYEIGNTWVFDYITIRAEEWSDPRWLEFEGQINIISSYEITDIKTIDTNFGALECYEITAIAANPYGEATLVAYFNSTYGFVKLDYTNINATKVFVELAEIKD